MKRLVILAINFYQKVISPFKTPCCCYFPTCSNYAKESINKFGVVKGIVKTFFRILRCNPFSKGGYDPV
ncbi:MAG: membrane protein insertion efficiency factor YidD [Oscillospiraceae bacterium]|jgi:putative membrane protein insertion efficiency factor|nr:membrane protein insertion efficiency factor YidD [Oscillospiraceae bacterium]